MNCLITFHLFVLTQAQLDNFESSTCAKFNPESVIIQYLYVAKSVINWKAVLTLLSGSWQSSKAEFIDDQLFNMKIGEAESLSSVAKKCVTDGGVHYSAHSESDFYQLNKIMKKFPQIKKTLLFIEKRQKNWYSSSGIQANWASGISKTIPGKNSTFVIYDPSSEILGVKQPDDLWSEDGQEGFLCKFLQSSAKYKSKKLFDFLNYIFNQTDVNGVFKSKGIKPLPDLKLLENSYNFIAKTVRGWANQSDEGTIQECIKIFSSLIKNVHQLKLDPGNIVFESNWENPYVLQKFLDDIGLFASNIYNINEFIISLAKKIKNFEITPFTQLTKQFASQGFGGETIILIICLVSGNGLWVLTWVIFCYCKRRKIRNKKLLNSRLSRNRTPSRNYHQNPESFKALLQRQTDDIESVD